MQNIVNIQFCVKSQSHMLWVVLSKVRKLSLLVGGRPDKIVERGYWKVLKQGFCLDLVFCGSHLSVYNILQFFIIILENLTHYNEISCQLKTQFSNDQKM